MYQHESFFRWPWSITLSLYQKRPTAPPYSCIRRLPSGSGLRRVISRIGHLAHANSLTHSRILALAIFS